jgi:hypothetical protein
MKKTTKQRRSAREAVGSDAMRHLLSIRFLKSMGTEALQQTVAPGTFKNRPHIKCGIPRVLDEMKLIGLDRGTIVAEYGSS